MSISIFHNVIITLFYIFKNRFLKKERKEKKIYIPGLIPGLDGYKTLSSCKGPSDYINFCNNVSRFIFFDIHTIAKHLHMILCQDIKRIQRRREQVLGKRGLVAELKCQWAQPVNEMRFFPHMIYFDLQKSF